MSWMAGLTSSIGSGIGSAASGLASGIGKAASAFNQGVGQGTGLWGGKPGTSPGGAMIKNPVSGGVTGAPQTGWSGVANQLGQMTGNYVKQQSPLKMDFTTRKPTSTGKGKTAEQMLDELAGRR